MENTLNADPTFEQICADAKSALAGFEGYFIERISYDTDGDKLKVWLQDRPNRPDAIITAGGLRHLSAGNTSDLDGSFVDDIELTFISRNADQWPEGMRGMGERRPGFPDLAWLRIVGPTDLEATVEQIQVYLDAAS